MRAIRVTTPGGPEALVVADVAPLPAPGPGQVKVKVEWAGVNYIDVYHRTGRYPMPAPFTPGMEGAGTVLAVGPDVAHLQPGQHVAWAMAPGSYAEEVLVPARVAVAVPEGVTTEQAAALMLQGMTAHFLCNDTFPLKPGHWAVVHAGAGGVGLLLTQLARARGAHVIATVSTDEKAALARAAGAQEVIRYDREPVPERVKALTGGAGAHVVYDSVGQATFDGSLASLRVRGMLVLYGAASGPVPPFELQRLNSGGSLFVTRPSLGHHTLTLQETQGRADALFEGVKSGQVSIRIHKSYSLEQAPQAHRDLEGRLSSGKLLIQL